MGTKMAVAFANIFMANIETQILSNSVAKPTIWKQYIDDIFSLWDVSKPDIDKFIEQANSHHPTIKFTAEISNTETTFLDTVVYKGKRFRDQSILDIKTCQKGIQEQHLKRTFTNSNHVPLLEVIQKIWSRHSFQSLIHRKGIGATTKHESRKEPLPFVAQYQPSVPNLKNVLMEKWHLVQNQPSLRKKSHH